jgi:tetratricopeptide (TPR) repeat protein
VFRRSLALSASVVRATPEDAETRDDEASMRMGYASVLQKLGRPGEALTQLDAAVGTLAALHEKDPEHVEFSLDLGEALDKRAAHRLEFAAAVGTGQDLGRSMGILDPTFRANPRNLTALRVLADCHQGLGDLAASRSDWKQAGIEYQKSLDLWDHWKQVGTSSVYDRQRRDAAALLVARAAKKTTGKTPLR